MVKVENWVRKYALEWRESDPGKGGHLNKHRGSQPLSALVTPLCYVPSPHYNKYVNFKRTFNIGIKDDYRGAITSASNEFHFSKLSALANYKKQVRDRLWLNYIHHPIKHLAPFKLESYQL